MFWQYNGWEMANKPFSCARSKSDPTPESKKYKKKYEELMEINHRLKQEYERLKMRYEVLNDMNRRLGGESNDLKIRNSQLEMQRVLLENEKNGTVQALNAQQDRNGKYT